MPVDRDKEILNYGIQYMSIVTVMSFGLFLQVIMERLLQATGKTFYSMIRRFIALQRQ